MKTKIGKRVVPVLPGKTEAYFSSGAHGEIEKGNYRFWTAVMWKGKRRRVWGRAPARRDAGERFRRIGKERLMDKSKANREVYGHLWELLQNVAYVRPSTRKEVLSWMDSHREDAAFVRSATFGRTKHTVKVKFSLS